MSTAATKNRREREASKDADALLRAQQRKTLAELRARLSNAKRERKRQAKAARAVCKSARKRARATAREIRARHVAAAKAEIAVARVEAETTCETRRARARQKAESSIARAGAALDAAQRYQASIRRFARKARPDKTDVRRAARERAHESDDNVRNNLPPELQAAWAARASRTKPTDRATRTEVFLDWAHNHPADVERYALQDIDRQVAELVRQEAKARRAMVRPTRSRAPRYSSDAFVPF